MKTKCMLGREVATLVDGVLNAGIHTTNFDASELPSGMYFYQVRAGNTVISKQMLLLK